MMNWLLLFVSFFISLANPSTVLADQSKELIVQFRADPATYQFPSDTVKDAVHESVGTMADQSRRGKLLPGMDLVTLKDGISIEDAINFYSQNRFIDLVKYAEPNYSRGVITGFPVSPPMTAEEVMQNLTISDYTAPTNDPMFSQQWALFNSRTPNADINAIEAWEIAKGSKEVIVAVVDTGINYRHPELQNSLWVNEGEIPGDKIDNDGNGYIDDVYGFNLLDRNGDVMDQMGHGSHVSGSIGAATDNKMGIAGINWNIRIMALRAVPDDGDETDADVIESFLYAAHHGAKVINCSFGKAESGQAVEDTINEIGKWGVLVVASAGNEGLDNDIDPSYPAGFKSSNLISIAAVTKRNSVPFWSNYGATSVDIGAPGDDILSSITGSSYASWSGTSMASPHITGAAALMLSFKPLLSAEEIKEIMISTAYPVASLNGRVVSNGTLDLGAAMQKLQ